MHAYNNLKYWVKYEKNEIYILSICLASIEKSKQTNKQTRKQTCTYHIIRAEIHQEDCFSATQLSRSPHIQQIKYLSPYHVSRGFTLVLLLLQTSSRVNDAIIRITLIILFTHGFNYVET